MPIGDVMGILLTGMIIATVGLFLVTLGVLMHTGELPMNRTIGICVGRVTESQVHWETGHRAAAPANIATGVVVQLLGVAIAAQPQYTMLVAGLVGSAWALVGLGAVVAWRLALHATQQLS